MVVEKIISFLLNRTWLISKDSQNFFELAPPAIFSLPDDFRLHIPKSLKSFDSERVINNLLEIIAEFYDLTIDDLNVILVNDNTVFKVRVYDEQTKDGRIPLNRFEELVERIRSILSDTASFVIDKSVISTRVPEEVSKYLGLCNFMQTEKGSFVAKIQLPSKEVIKDRELFNPEEIYSEQVNQKLSEVLDFVNKSIFEGDSKVSDEFLLDNESRINIKLFKDIESFFDKANLKNIDFSFHNILNSNIIVNRNITKHKLFKLNQFVEELESHAYEIGEFTFKGKITTLKSKDPDGLKNSVTFAGINDDNRSMIAIANIDSESYKDAIEAHKLKQYIVVTGLAKKTKTRIRFTEITNFNIED